MMLGHSTLLGTGQDHKLYKRELQSFLMVIPNCNGY